MAASMAVMMALVVATMVAMRCLDDDGSRRVVAVGRDDDAARESRDDKGQGRQAACRDFQEMLQRPKRPWAEQRLLLQRVDRGGTFSGSAAVSRCVHAKYQRNKRPTMRPFRPGGAECLKPPLSLLHRSLSRQPLH